MTYKQARVHGVIEETRLKEEVTETIDPSLGSLFKTIKCSAELIDMRRAESISVIWRLFHVHKATEIAMQEGILDIKLSEIPFYNYNECEHNTNCGKFNIRRKCL